MGVAVLHILPGLEAVAADQAKLARGERIARSLCSPCHAIGKSDPSPTRANADTAFRDLHKRYPIPMLTDAARTGTIEGHDEMPSFRLPRSNVDDLLAYIDSMSPEGAPRYSVKTR
jgi:cytochrome c